MADDVPEASATGTRSRQCVPHIFDRTPAVSGSWIRGELNLGQLLSLNRYLPNLSLIYPHPYQQLLELRKYNILPIYLKETDLAHVHHVAHRHSHVGIPHDHTELQLGPATRITKEIREAAKSERVPLGAHFVAQLLYGGR